MAGPSTFAISLRAIAGVIALMALLFVTVPSIANAGDIGQKPAQVVTALGQDLGALASHTSDMNATQRLDSVEILLNLYFDLNQISANAIGAKRFGELSPDQQQEYTRAYSRFMVASYINRLTQFRTSGLRVEETTDGPQGLKLVRAKYETDGGETALLDFVLTPKSSTWQVIDVRQEGKISEIALRRAEVASVYRREGYDGLIDLLKKKTQALASR